MPGQLTRAVRNRRAHEAKAVSLETGKAFREAAVGQILPVLFESTETEGSLGYSDTYLHVRVPEKSLRGQLRQIRETEKKDKSRVYGELLNAYGYGVPEGAKSCVLDNYYTGEKLTVPLDPRLTPQQNAKKYFDRYTKLKRTYEALSRLTVEVKAEIDHLESIRTSLDLSTGEGDLAMIRKEMEDAGFIRRHSDSKKGRSRTPQSRPLHYISSDGFDLYVGKNNLQNDELTFKMAAPSDIWFHANDMPGSHVILKARGLAMNDIPDRVFEEAASLAAWYSSGRAQGKVEIDYLERRDVKKPGGARPGFVVYYTNYSILANPDISMLTQAD